MYIETVPNRGSRPAYLLRESKRDGKKVVKRTIANLSSLPDAAIETLRVCLRGGTLCDASEQTSVLSTIPAGHVMASEAARARIGMEELV